MKKWLLKWLPVIGVGAVIFIVINGGWWYASNNRVDNLIVEHELEREREQQRVQLIIDGLNLEINESRSAVDNLSGELDIASAALERGAERLKRSASGIDDSIGIAEKLISDGDKLEALIVEARSIAEKLKAFDGTKRAERKTETGENIDSPQ